MTTRQPSGGGLSVALPQYEQYFMDASPSRFLRIIEALVLCHLKPGSAVLDLCCGSGDLSSALSQHGFAVTGLETSQAMLKVARHRQHSVSYIEGAAKDFSLPDQFEAVLSMQDRLNWVENIHKLILVFANVHEALKSGGYFLFDLSDRNRFSTDLQNVFPQHHQLAVQDRVWDGSVHNFHPQEIICALEEGGFRNITAFAAEDLGMKEEAGRYFYLGRKF